MPTFGGEVLARSLRVKPPRQAPQHWTLQSIKDDSQALKWHGRICKGKHYEPERLNSTMKFALQIFIHLTLHSLHLLFEIPRLLFMQTVAVLIAFLRGPARWISNSRSRAELLECSKLLCNTLLSRVFSGTPNNGLYGKFPILFRYL